MKGNSPLFNSYNNKGSKSPKIIRKKNFLVVEHPKAPTKSTPNSITIVINSKNGSLIQERYYDENGDPYLDIDYINHGNSNSHPEIPHEHIWIKNKKGELIRTKWRKTNDKGWINNINRNWSRNRIYL